jgi:hypothetical protein
MRLFLVPAVVLLLAVPAVGDDEFLKQIFNGDDHGVALFQDGTPDDMIEMDTGTDGDESADAGDELDPIYDRYINDPPKPGEPGHDDYVAWYLEGVEGAYRPDGMTDDEYAGWVNAGCPGEDDVTKCGVTD